MSASQESANAQHLELIVSAPDNQFQNRVSERSIRFVQNAAGYCAIKMKILSFFGTLC